MRHFTVIFVFIILLYSGANGRVHKKDDISSNIETFQCERIIIPVNKVVGNVSNIETNWAQDGNIWYYTQRTINPDVIAYCTFESVTDTVINGISCKKIIETEYHEKGIAREIPHYMYSNGDSVFFFKEDEFHLLYDFSADKGDVISLGYYETYDGKPLEMEIDSVGNLQVNGSTRKVQYVKCGDGISIEFGGHVIQGIGNTMYMFPTFDENKKGPLRCYLNDKGSRFINPFYQGQSWNRQDCDQIMLSSRIIDSEEDDISIFPFPAKDYIIIRNVSAKTGFSIFDLNGSVLKQGVIFNYSEQINISDLDPGIYFLKLFNKDLELTKKIIKK